MAHLSVSQVSVRAGGRRTPEVRLSVAGWIFSFVSSIFLHRWAAIRGGVSSAHQITGNVPVVQRLHSAPGGGKSVSPALKHTNTRAHADDWLTVGLLLPPGSLTYQEL